MRQSLMYFAASVFILGVLGSIPALGQDAKGVRRVPIPPRENGYDNFQSQVIGTQDQLDAFLKTIKADGGWNKKADFLKAIGDAKVNFATEALVLIRLQEASGSTVVTFGPTELKGEKLTCPISRVVADFGTADIADYCLAFVVPRGQVREVDVVVDKKSKEVLKVPAK